MRESLVEVAFEVGAFLLYGVATTLLAGLGGLFEYRSYLFINSGETTIALYAGALGLVLLTFAYLVGRNKLAKAWAEMQAELS